MKTLSDYMVISDVDGTLLGYDGVLPRRNIEAVRRFVEGGGRFGIATGRSRRSMEKVTRDVPINAPCVLYNGGELYDPVADRVMLELFLPDAARGYLERIGQAAPWTEAMVVCDGTYHLVREANPLLPLLREGRWRNPQVRDPAQLTFPWQKLLFHVRESEQRAFLDILEAMDLSDVQIVPSAYTMVEMLPLHSSKGNALELVIEAGMVRRENLVTIGDYYNDLTMIQMAGIGATLSTSPQDIRQAADLVVGDCEGGAVADVIEHLERIAAEQSK